MRNDLSELEVIADPKSEARTEGGKQLRRLTTSDIPIGMKSLTELRPKRSLEPVPEFDTKRRKPFRVMVIHHQPTVRGRIIDSLHQTRVDDFECSASFEMAIDAGRIKGPGIVFVDMRVFRQAVKALLKVEGQFAVVPLATDDLIPKAIAAVRSKAAPEWIDSRSGFTGIFAKEATRRAYCRAYNRLGDLQLMTPNGVPVTISEETRLRIKALTPTLRKTLMLLCRGLDRDAVAYRMGVTRSDVATSICLIVKALKCFTFSEACRQYMAVTVRPRR